MPLKGTKALEAWCQRVTSDYQNVEITNMSSSWRNGLGFCAIIHHHCPHLINYSSLDPGDVFGNNQLAFQVAEEHLEIPSLLDPQDMVSCQVLDKLSILTYLAQYYKALHNPAALQLRARTSPPAIYLARENTADTGVEEAKDKVDAHKNTSLAKQTMADDNQSVLNTATAKQSKNSSSFTPHVIQPLSSTSTTPVNQPTHTPDKQPVISISTTPQVNQPLNNPTPDKQLMISTVTTPPDKQPLNNHTLDKQPMISTSTTPPVKQPLNNHTLDKQPMISTSTTPPVKQPLNNHTLDKQPMISTITTPPVKQSLRNCTPDKQPMIRTSTTPVKEPLHNHHTPDKQPTIITTSDQLASSSHSPADRQPGDECLVCGLAVFILERCSAGGGHPLHRACARCGRCGLPGVGRGYRVERGQVVCGLCQKKENACNEDCQTQSVTDAAVTHSSSSREIRKGPPPPKPARTFQAKQELLKHLGSSSLAPSARCSSNSSVPSSPDKKESVDLPSKKETQTIVKSNREAVLNSSRLEQCNQELFDLDIKIVGLEKQGIIMEKKIRKSLEFQEANDEFECVFDPREDDLIIQLFDLVNEKNELVRKQSEVMFLKKERMLEIEQVECEQQVRVLLDKSPWLKTEGDKLEEDLLINNIIEIVKRRNEIINHLEMDRIRETEEDSAFSDVKLKLINSEDLQNIEKKPRKTSARKRLMSWISRKN